MNGEKFNEKDWWHTIIIGAGQAGLAAGYSLQTETVDFVIIDAAENVGDSWRIRWDSLHLFTPAQYDGLPGLPYPAPGGTFPSKDEMAEYLKKYALKFNLPVRLNEKVTRLAQNHNGFEITTTRGKLNCTNVIIATGSNRYPRIPGFAKEIDKDIQQIHSSQYVNPDSISKGDTLVVGAGTSGMEIAIELAGSRNTYISGKPTFHIPDRVFRYAGGLYWWFVENILTVRTPIGRKAKEKVLTGGGPLINVSVKDLIASGVEQVPRVTAVENGLPKLEDGRVMHVSSIVWATGFKPDFSWIDLKVTDEKTGWPLNDRGISTITGGMYFIGMLFQYGLTSGLVGGVGRDATFIARHIRHRINKHGV